MGSLMMKPHGTWYVTHLVEVCNFFSLACNYDLFGIPFIRMMLLGALSTLRIRQKPWTKGKIPQFLFQWKLLNAISEESLLG